MFPAQILQCIGKQRIRGDTVGLQELRCSVVLVPCHGQKQMVWLNLPLSLGFGLPSGIGQELFCLSRQSLRQGQIWRSRTVQQLGHSLRQIRVHPQLTQNQSRPAGLPGHHQQQVRGANVAVAQGFCQTSGAFNQLRR